MSGSDLIWPPERPRAAAPGSEWSQARSNLCLDFHGDPANAQLVVFSDGNHHMALAECVEAFVRRSPGLHEVFYTTTPPSVYLALLRTGELSLGNLTLRVRPNVVIGPREVVERLHAEGETGAPVAFARSRGNAYLVRAGNPKGIRGVADLLRPDVVPFMSNPDTEAASYGVYRETMLATARIRGLDVEALERRLSGEGGDIMFGERIHHREAPQALADGKADRVRADSGQHCFRRFRRDRRRSGRYRSFSPAWNTCRNSRGACSRDRARRSGRGAGWKRGPKQDRLGRRAPTGLMAG